MFASEIGRSLHPDKLVSAHGSACQAEFIQALRNDSNCNLEAFLAARPRADRKDLPILVAIDMRHRLANGQPYQIESYLERFPELAQNRDQLIDLIYAEYCVRRNRGSNVDAQDYYRRFPEYRDSLDRLFRLDSLLEADVLASDSTGACVIPLPSEGNTFLEFRLKTKLGQGAFGSVFLAEQTNLSDRRVVVKITPHRTIEHRTMARLDHPNIVPIMSVHHDHLTDLQAVCMPYQSAVALSDLRAEWGVAQAVPDRAAAWLSAVGSAISPGAKLNAQDLDSIGFPKDGDFVTACVWIMHKLAGALHHAHLRGIYHRDLKPSNILLTTHGQPLLVDFNLSFDRVESAGEGAGGFVGGTLPYMPSEQIEALHPMGQGRADDVGPRADVFSLAVTIFELLTGQLPFGTPERGPDILTALRTQLEKRHGPIPSARAINPAVPADVDAVLMKCLDPVAHHRYESAAQLGDDLGLILQDRPPRHVAATPMHWRIYKFARRNQKRLLIGAGTTVATAAALAILLTSHLRAEHERHKREQSETLASQLQTSADKEADEAMSRIPPDGYRYFLLGREFFLARQFAHAIRCFTKAIELECEYAPAYYYRGRAFANLDKDAEALTDYAKSIEYNPSDYFPYLTRAVCFATSETHADASRALIDLEAAIARMPDRGDERSKMIYLEIARVYSAVSVRIGNQDLQANLLERAEQTLVHALDLGLDPAYLLEAKSRDRFRMLDPVFEKRAIQQILVERFGEFSPVPR